MTFRSLHVAVVGLVLLVALASVSTPLGSVLAQEQTNPDDPPAEVWSHTYGGPRDDRGTHVVRTEDGYLVAGTTRSFGQATANRADLWLIRTNETGREQWTRTYGSGSDESPRTLLVTDDGYLLVGAVGTAEGVELYGLNTDGDVQWSRLYGVGTGVGDALAHDDGYLLVGQRVTGGGSQPAALLSVDGEGRLTDIQNVTGRRAAKERFTAVIETRDSTYLVVGESDRSEDDVNAWAVEVTADGETLWTTVLGSSSVEVQTAGVVELPDGDYLLVGTQERNRVAAGWVARLGPDGEVQWRRTYPEMTFSDVAVDDEGVLLVGSFREDRSAVSDALVLALDGRGSERWRQTYGGDESEAFASLEPTDGGYLFVGWTSSRGAGRDDVYVVAVEYPVHARELAVSQATVEPGQSVQVSATVVNRAEQRRSHQATLRVDGAVRETKAVVIPPGEERTVSFQLDFAETGTYAVAIDGLTPVEVAVAEPETPTPTLTPESTASPTPAPTPTPEPTSSPTPAPTTETASPGFGVVLGVVALVLLVVSVVMGRRHRRQRD